MFDFSAGMLRKEDCVMSVDAFDALEENVSVAIRGPWPCVNPFFMNRICLEGHSADCSSIAEVRLSISVSMHRRIWAKKAHSGNLICLVYLNLT